MNNIIVTVDTESHVGSNPVEHLIWGKTSTKEEYGINRIMDICDSFSAKTLFFVDVAEAWDYGKDKIADVIRHIRKRGHDVGVHIHPDHMADRNKLFLWEYSKGEQREIITKCTDLYAEITGELPGAFRAGKYGANRDTLDILDELGYKFDFSQFYGQKWCGINPPVCTTLPNKYKNIIEMPVTIFKSMKFRKFKRYDKVDAVMDSAEFRHIMDRIAADKRDIVVSLFYHSFSMLDWKDNPDEPSFNPREERKFINTLKYVSQSGNFRFISLSYLEESCESIKFGEKEDSVEDIISTKGLLRSAYFTFKRAYRIRKYNKKAKYLVHMLLLGGVLIFVFLILTFSVFILPVWRSAFS